MILSLSLILGLAPPTRHPPALTILVPWVRHSVMSILVQSGSSSSTAWWLALVGSMDPNVHTSCTDILKRHRKAGSYSHKHYSSSDCSRDA